MTSSEPIPDSVDESYDPSKLIVNYLPLTVDNASLKEMFAPYGTVEEAKIITDHLTKISRGYGFVKFSNPEEAEKAIEGLNGKPVDAGGAEPKLLHVGVSKPPKVDVNLYVGNLLQDAKQEELKAVFSQFGTVVECNIPLDRTTGMGRGYGFVRVDSKTAARKAIEALNGNSIPSLSGSASLTVKHAENNNNNGMNHGRNGRFNNMDRRRYHPPQQPPRMMPGFMPTPVTFEGICLFVYNIPPTMDERGLSQLFSPYGSVTGARVIRHMNRSKGYGFVNMSTSEEANRAISNLSGRCLVPEKPLQVSLKKDKE